jgi:hypothetical protein
MKYNLDYYKGSKDVKQYDLKTVTDSFKEHAASIRYSTVKQAES